MKRFMAPFHGTATIEFTFKESKALERLLEREQQYSAYVQVHGAELAAAREAEWLERIYTLEERVGKLDSKEIDGRTERRVSQRRRDSGRRGGIMNRRHKFTPTRRSGRHRRKA